MFKLASTLSLGILLTLATACSKQDTPTPTIGSRTAGTNNVAPIDPPTGGGGGGGGYPSCTVGPASTTLKAQIKKKASLICAQNQWTIITTTTPPDGFTYGLGCITTPYPFSVDVYVQNPDGTYRYTYASGTYDENSGAITLSL